MCLTQNQILYEVERIITNTVQFPPEHQAVLATEGFRYSARDCDCRSCTYHIGETRRVQCSLNHCPFIQERLKAGVASKREILMDTISSLTFPLMSISYKKETNKREGKIMDYKNDKHRIVFTEAIRKKEHKDYDLMAAIYLLTSDFRLWQKVKNNIDKREIDFEQININGIHESGYTIFCAAKDLYLGTHYLSICDLADTALVAPKIFSLICNAMAIKRFGLLAIN